MFSKLNILFQTATSQISLTASVWRIWRALLHLSPHTQSYYTLPLLRCPSSMISLPSLHLSHFTDLFALFSMESFFILGEIVWALFTKLNLALVVNVRMRCVCVRSESGKQFEIHRTHTHKANSFRKLKFETKQYAVAVLSSNLLVSKAIAGWKEAGETEGADYTERKLTSFWVCVANSVETVMRNARQLAFIQYIYSGLPNSH